MRTMTAIALTLVVAVLAGVAPALANGGMPVDIQITPAPPITVGTPYTVTVSTLAGATCVGVITYPDNPAHNGGFNRAFTADARGKIVVKFTTSGKPGPRTLIVTCTLKDQQGTASLDYSLQ